MAYQAHRCYAKQRRVAGRPISERREARGERRHCDLRARTCELAPLASLFLGALLLPAVLSAQAVDTPRPPTVPPKKITAPPSAHPEVVNLTLKGVKVVRQDDLRNNIYTTASYCNSFILKPFCWISKSKYFYTHKYLDHQELQRDVLRIRVYYWKRGYRETEVDTAVVPRGKNQGGVTFTIQEGPATVVSDIVVTQD